MSGAGCPWADISTTIARRSFTGSFAVLVIRCNLCPSAIDTCRTNTFGRLPTGHHLPHPHALGDSRRDRSSEPTDYTINVQRRGSSCCAAAGSGNRAPRICCTAMPPGRVSLRSLTSWSRCPIVIYVLERAFQLMKLAAMSGGPCVSPQFPQSVVFAGLVFALASRHGVVWQRFPTARSCCRYNDAVNHVRFNNRESVPFIAHSTGAQLFELVLFPGRIRTYLSEMVNEFIMGVEPLDNFDKYVSPFKKMGIEKIVRIQHKVSSCLDKKS